MRFLFAGVCAAAIALMPQSSDAAIVFSEGFETPATAAGNLLIKGPGSTVGDNWLVSGPTGVLLLNNTYSENPPLFNANSGNQSLDLSGVGNTGANAVSKTISGTVNGQVYKLSFFVGRADNFPTPGRPYYYTPATIGLRINDSAVVLSYTNSDVNPGKVDWNEFSYEFTGVGTSTKIEFSNLVPQSPDPEANSFAGLDDVTMASVPEPASVALLGLGCLGAGLIRRRRNQA